MRPRFIFAAAIAIALTACSSQPGRKVTALVESIAADESTKSNQGTVVITARSRDGASGSRRVLTARLTCKVGDQVHAIARGVSLEIDQAACEREGPPI